MLPPEQADAAIVAGRVEVSGRVVREPLALVRPEDEVRLDGKRLRLEAPSLVIAFHKPAGCVVSNRSEAGAPTVFDLLRAALTPKLARYGWHAVGRLIETRPGSCSSPTTSGWSATRRAPRATCPSATSRG